MCLLVPSGAVFASDGTNPVIQVQRQNGRAGDTVTVDVVVTGNPGIAGATLQVEYDEKLVLQSAENGTALSELTFTQPAKLESPSKFLWDSERGMSKQDGTMLILQFGISENAAEGEELPIHISYVDGDIFDENLEDVNLQLIDGVVTVEKEGEKDCSVTGHIPKEAVAEDEVKATHRSEGSYNLVVRCEKCGEIISSTKVVTDKIPHTPGEPVKENEVAATHSSRGSYDLVVYCTEESCKEELSRNTVFVEKEDHVPAAAIRENEVSATCVKEGSYDSVIKCSVCGEVLSTTKITIPKTEHKIVIDVAVEPTYTKEGLTQGEHCSVCSTVLVEQKKIEKLEKKNAKITVSKKTFTYKAKTVKKKKQTFKIGAKVSGNGKLTYKKVSGNKSITVSKAGKVTIKKGTKKGTYKFAVQIKAAESAQYKAKTQKVTLRIKIK